MSSSLRRVLMLVLATAMVAAACGSDDPTDTQPGASVSDDGETASEPQTGGDLVVARADPIDGWNPDNAISQATYQTLPMVYDSLLRFTPDGQGLEAGLAESWEYDADGLTYTFKLRDGLMFSDGAPLTSADVAFSVGVWQSGPVLGILYGAIDNVETPDDTTVIFNLAYPDTVLPAVLTWASSAIILVDYGGVDAEAYFTSPIGAGPFVLDNWSPGSEIVLTKNPNYWGPPRGYRESICSLSGSSPI